MSWLYTLATLFAMFTWPLLLQDSLTPPALALVFLLNAAIAINTWYQCSSPELPFPTGLNTIASSMNSGCARITLVYLPLLLIYVYILCLLYSISGTLQRRARAQLRFRALVKWFDLRHLNTPLAPSNYIPALRSSELKLDGTDPEPLLIAAARCDKQGDWERATALYQHVQATWPEEHGVYAENCIKEIERKRGLADGQQSA